MEETTKQAAQHASEIAPIWALAGGAALTGGVAQAGVTLALGMSYSTARFVGFVLVSMIISGGLTVVLADGFGLSPLISAVAGALTGTIPSLIVVRAVLQKLLAKYEVDLGAETMKMMDPQPPREPARKEGDST